MKKLLSIMLVVIMLVSLVACSNTAENKLDPEITTPAEWQQMYEKVIQEYIDADVYISSIYIGDMNNDGIPTVAFSTNPYFYKTPNVILNFVDGKIAEISDFETEDSGSAVTEKTYFVNGTNYIVYRSYGNTTGTFNANEFQKIYSISKSEEYEIVSEKEFEMSADMAKEYNEMLASSDADITKYQKSIISQMDEEVKTVTGNDAELVEYQSVARDYTISSEPEPEINMKDVVQYINDKLDIELTTKQ